MNFDYLIDQIPDYQRFFYVDEFDKRSEELVKRFPGVVKVYEAGRSRSGHPIKVIEIGSGSKNALLFGCPHPNEPIGAMMLDFLAEKLAEDERLRSYFDYTWYMVKVVDPDGVKLNEGWFSNPQSIKSYASNFYRPPGYKQVEWTFPVDYKTLHFHDPLPETQVLMKLIEEKKPVFMYSLHNAGFGGVYYYISEDSPQLYEHFHSIPRRFNVPLALGEPEVPYLRMLSKAVYKLSPITEEYDYLEKYSRVDPAEIIKAGASSDEYARRIANTFSLVCEVPYYYDPRIENISESDITRKEARLIAWESAQKQYEFVGEIFELIKDKADFESPFYEVLKNYVETMPKHLEAEKNWIENDSELVRKATVAEVFDNTCVTQFYQSLTLGMLRRFISEILERHPSEELVQTAKRVDAEFEQNIAYLDKNLSYKAIPIRDLVGIQLLAGLITAEYVQSL